jgi:hypothetical protein
MNERGADAYAHALETLLQRTPFGTAFSAHLERQRADAAATAAREAAWQRSVADARDAAVLPDFASMFARNWHVFLLYVLLWTVVEYRLYRRYWFWVWRFACFLVVGVASAYAWRRLSLRIEV